MFLQQGIQVAEGHCSSGIFEIDPEPHKILIPGKTKPTLGLWNIWSQQLCSLLLIPLLCDVP